MNTLPPGLLGYEAARQGNLQAGTQQIHQLGGLLGIQQQFRQNADQDALKRAVVMGPNGEIDQKQTLSNIYRINPQMGLQFQAS